MKIVADFFYLFIYLVATFCFVVLFGHGFGGFAQGVRIELLNLLR
ncbi:MAG: hypothetical protein ACC661_07050 [Verrucomicrobiales bacterium]